MPWRAPLRLPLSMPLLARCPPPAAPVRRAAHRDPGTFTAAMTLDSYLRAAPMAELHVHLEGAVAPATFLTLVRRNRVALPA
jgi:hypothetical protein